MVVDMWVGVKWVCGCGWTSEDMPPLADVEAGLVADVQGDHLFTERCFDLGGWVAGVFLSTPWLNDG